MVKKKLLAAILAAVVMVTTVTDTMAPASAAQPAEAAEPVETVLERTKVSNPILSSYPANVTDSDGTDLGGTVLYGGDPSVMVEDDTVYLYTGRDIPIDLSQVDKNGNKVADGYYMFEWQCYTSKDLLNWEYKGVIMSADKKSITWTSSGTDAWAGQITYHFDSELKKKFYYFYNCTWDATSDGKQSIGAAVADTPFGWSSAEAKAEYCEAKNIPNNQPELLHFVDLGKPLVKGTFTTEESSGWNDIDPTVWVETVDGVEHRYLSWGNSKAFVCELNDDMISIKDVNGDGKITFGIQAKGADSTKADVLEKDTKNLGIFTEAPWIYRRKDADGKPTGPYYFFYAYDWREQMAYATIDDLMDGTFEGHKILMPPTATSNTNHMAVFDFNGKTYFVYHNGSVRGGSGFRRTACITEMHFNEDGSIQPIPETAIGITGDKPYYLFSNQGRVVSHENYVNSGLDSAYPYMDVKVGTYYQPEKLDASWAIVDGKADTSNQSYVSIQSENKPGLYLTVNDDNNVTLAHDWNYSDGFIKNGFTKPQGEPNKITTFDEAMGKAQTFRTVKGLEDSEKAVSFESVAKPGYYLCVDGSGSLVVKALADCGASADFYLNEPPESFAVPDNPNKKNDIVDLKINGTVPTKSGHTFECEVPYETKSVQLSFSLQDTKGYATVDGKMRDDLSDITIPLTGLYTKASVCVYSQDRRPRVTYTVIVKKAVSESDITAELWKNFDFEEQTDSAVAVKKGAPGTTPTEAEVEFEYVDGAKGGKAIRLPGEYGLKLCDAAGLSKNYSISYWMKPEVLGTNVDPTLAAGTFAPEYWLNLTFGRSIWSNNGGFIDDAGTLTYEKDKWQLVTLAVNDNKAKLYVNGELRGNGSIASDIMGKENAAIYFGVNAWDAYFTGALDDMKIYDGTLSEKDVMTIASSAIEKPAELPQPDPTAPVPGGSFADDEVMLPPEKPETPPTDNDKDPSKPAPDKPTTTPDKPTTTPDKPAPAPQAKVTKVTVKAANQKAGVKTVYLKKGGKVTLEAAVEGTGDFNKAVDWSTSKKNVATVNKGAVKAKGVGTAKITVTSQADKSKKATITVKVSKKAVKNKKLTLKAKKKTLKAGETYTVAIKSMTKKTTDAVTYKSSKSGVASVDKFGVVTAKKAGKATITVKCGKKSAKLALTVKK